VVPIVVCYHITVRSCQPATALHGLRLSGRAVGLCEFEGIDRSDIALASFGLVRDAQGYWLGPYLLDRGLREI
jgi:hypothetical protein